MSRFTNALIVSPLSDGKTWVLMQPFGYDVGKKGSDDPIDVEAGFMTDFASIPQPFWIILSRWGKYGNAAVVHDWLYWKQKRQRAEADKIMFEAMTVLSVAAWQKYPIYWAVRALGWLAWNRNQWDKEAGFERVIKRKRFRSTKESGRLNFILRTWRHYISHK